MKSAPVKSVARVLEILELFAESRQPMTLNQVVKVLAYPVSSTMMILKSMVRLGYLNFNLDTKTYFPTDLVRLLGDWVSSQESGGEAVNALISELAQATGETIVLGVQNDIYIHFLRVLDSQHSIRFYVPEGGMRPLVMSNLGWILLAEQPIDKVERIIDRILTEEPRRTRDFNRANFFRELNLIQQNGYCYVAGLPAAGAGAITMLLPSFYHDQPLAIAVGGYVERLDKNKERIIATMRELIMKFDKAVHRPPPDPTQPFQAPAES